MKTKICSGAFHDLITFKQDTHNNYSCQSDVFSKKLKEEKHIKINGAREEYSLILETITLWLGFFTYTI